MSAIKPCSGPVNVKRPEDWFEAGPAAVKLLREFRRDLHQNPELSFDEHRTADRIIGALKKAGLTLTRRFSDTGVAVWVKGAGRGPTVALRGDIDALPIQELNQIPFVSQVPGVMHACGHDVHAAWALGAALLLQQRPAEGDVVVIFQPAEELGLGAAKVLESGVLDDAEMIFGAHVDPRWVVGEAVADIGPVGAATDEFELLVTGRGSHGARPQLGHDPIVAAAALVTELQSVVSRRIAPGDPAVLSVGEFQSGTAANVIPDQARISGTLRSVSSATRSLLREAVQQMAEGVAASFGVEIALSFGGGTPPVINDAVACGYASSAVLELLGDQAQQSLAEPNMGGEDFAVYLTEMPGCFIRVGSRFSHDPIVGAHTPRFLPRTDCVYVGASLLAAAARNASA